MTITESAQSRIRAKIRSCSTIHYASIEICESARFTRESVDPKIRLPPSLIELSVEHSRYFLQ